MFITGTFPFSNISKVCINMQFSCFDCFNVDIDCSNGWRTDEFHGVVQAQGYFSGNSTTCTLPTALLLD